MKIRYILTDKTSNLELTQEQAQQIIDHYFRIYPDFRLNTPIPEHTEEYKKALREQLIETKRGQYVLVRGEQQTVRNASDGFTVVSDSENEPADEKDYPDRS